MAQVRLRNRTVPLRATFRLLGRLGTGAAGRRGAGRPAGPPRVCVLYPAAAGSVGDEAILLGVLRILEPREPEVTVIGIPPLPAPPAGVRTEVLPSRRVRPLYLRRLRRALRGYDAVLVLGADMLDGGHGGDSAVNRLLVAAVADSLAIPTVVVGFSWSDRPDGAALVAIRNLHPRVALVSRDAVSHGRVEAAVGRTVRRCADPAFLMCDPQADAGVDVPGTLRLGLNLNDRVTSANPALVEVIERFLAELDEQVVLVGIPHDSRGARSDWRVLGEFASRAGVDIDLPPTSWSALDVHQAVASCDLVVTCRMHAAVAALAEGVPVLGLGYQGKFEGLAEHFGLQWVADASAVGPDELRSLLESYVRDRASLRRLVADRLPTVLGLARQAIPDDVLDGS